MRRVLLLILIVNLISCTSKEIIFENVETSQNFEYIPEFTKVELPVDCRRNKECLKIVRDQYVKSYANIFQALPMYIEACKKGQAFACSKYAVYIKSTLMSAEYVDLEAKFTREMLLELQQDCIKKNALSCYTLGSIEELGIFNDASTTNAFKYRIEACKYGDKIGCNAKARALYFGEGTEKNLKQAIKIFKELCEGGDTYGCAQLGFSYHKGNGVVKSNSLAMKYFLQACNSDIGFGCYGVAKLYAIGEEVEKSDKLAVEYTTRSCKLFYADGCMMLADAYENGRYVKKSFSKSFELYDWACKLGSAKGCKYLADYYEKGIIVDKSSDMARLYKDKACKLGNEKECHKQENHKNESNPDVN